MANTKNVCTHLERKLNYRPLRILNTPTPISINLQLSENHIYVCIYNVHNQSSIQLPGLNKQYVRNVLFFVVVDIKLIKKLKIK